MGENERMREVRRESRGENIDDNEKRDMGRRRIVATRTNKRIERKNEAKRKKRRDEKRKEK